MSYKARYTNIDNFIKQPAQAGNFTVFNADGVTTSTQSNTPTENTTIRRRRRKRLSKNLTPYVVGIGLVVGIIILIKTIKK